MAGAYETLSYDAGTYGHGHQTGESFSSGSLSGQESFSYDGRGQVTNTALKIGGSSPYSVQSMYTEAGQLATQTYPTLEVVTYGYGTSSLNSFGWLTGLSTQQGGTTTQLLGGVNYQGPGGAEQRITNATLGSGSGAYTYAATFDPLVRATDIKVSAAQTLFEQSRTFDGAGNVSTTATTLPAGTDNQAFCYDDQNRLTWAGSVGTPPCTGTPIVAGTLTAAQYSDFRSYDNLGRLTSRPNSFATYGQDTYVYGDASHLHAVTSINGQRLNQTLTAYSASYDAAGNMTCRDRSSFNCAGANAGAQLSYDNEGRLTGWQNSPSSPTSSALFLYDSQGNRVEQQVTQSGTATTTVYIGNLEEVTSSGGSTTTTTYYYAGSSRIAEAVNGVVSYLAADGLSSATVALNSSGSATASILYAPYGTPRYSSGTMPTSYGFTGQRADAATGLDYYNARYYDAVAGQFISADTVLPGGGYDILGLSRYAYVEGNPEVRTDPSGDVMLCGGPCAAPGSAATPPTRIAPGLREAPPTRGTAAPRACAYGMEDKGCDAELGYRLGYYSSDPVAWRCSQDPVCAKGMSEGSLELFLLCPCLGDIGEALGLERLLAAGAGGVGEFLGKLFGLGAGKAPEALPEALTIGRNAEEGVSVYRGVSNGEQVYSGITNDLDRRALQHGDRFSRLVDLTENGTVTRGEARAIEQALIARDVGQNLRNEISPLHPWHQQAVDWGEAWLQANGVP